jgi:succinate dehydrogenase (ubiquinone) cytochrome b560 subunit
MNRVTGAAMWGGFSLVGSLALVGVDVASYVSALGSVPVIGFTAKFAVAFSVTYHYMGALRHMYWDNKPEALETEDVTKLSYAIIGAASVVSSGIALI